MKGVHTNHPLSLTACVLALALSLTLVGGCTPKVPGPDVLDGPESSAPQDDPGESTEGQGSEDPDTVPDDGGDAHDVAPGEDSDQASDDAAPDDPSDDIAEGGETDPNDSSSEIDSDKDSAIDSYKSVLETDTNI